MLSQPTIYKTGKIYSLEYSGVPKVFFTSHHVIIVTQGRCSTKIYSKNVIRSSLQQCCRQDAESTHMSRAEEGGVRGKVLGVRVPGGQGMGGTATRVK